MANDAMSDEDKTLFREQMRDVKPLIQQTQRVKTPKANLTIPVKKSRSHQQQLAVKSQNYYLSDFISEEILSETLMSYCHPSVPSKRFKALRHGEIPWESRLDLHGFKIDAARESLIQFIENQSQNNKRCLLIIHGKGGHQGTPPVLKNHVNRWLPQFDEVLAFHSALAKDGGRGAVYVLLRRNREDD